MSIEETRVFTLDGFGVVNARTFAALSKKGVLRPAGDSLFDADSQTYLINKGE